METYLSELAAEQYLRTAREMIRTRSRIFTKKLIKALHHKALSQLPVVVVDLVEVSSKQILECGSNSVDDSNKINIASADADAKKCSNCLKQYKSTKWLMKHLLEKKCLVEKNNGNYGNGTANPPIINVTPQLYIGAGPSTSSGNSNIKSESTEEEEKILFPKFVDYFAAVIRSMNSKRRIGDSETTGDDDDDDDARYHALYRMLARECLKRLRERLVEVGSYLRRPLLVAQPEVHLDAAFWFALTAMGRVDDMWDALPAPGVVGPYKLIVAYMKAFVVNVNAYCCRKSAETAGLDAVLMKRTDFWDAVRLDGACGHLYGRDTPTMDRYVRFKVRGTVDHMFREWTGDRLEAYLVCQQYERLRRNGLVETVRPTSGGPAPNPADLLRKYAAAAAAFPDAADPERLSLWSFCTARYTSGYLDEVRNSVYFFAVPFLERVTQLFVESGGVLNEAVVMAAVRHLNIPWFHDRDPAYRLSDLYEHPGLDSLEAEQLAFSDKVRGVDTAFFDVDF